MRLNGAAAAAAWGLDRLLGEPPTAWHPVARFGSMMTAVERRIYRDARAAGVTHLVIGGGTAVAAGFVLRRVLGGPMSTAVAATVAIAGRMLADEATAIGGLAASDLPAARRRLRGLVGRATDDLDEEEVARAVIESVAENTVDAVTAPLLWAAVGGAPAVLGHRAINTLDAMVGHRSARYTNFGWAGARADDVANWLPARVSAAAVAIVRPRNAGAVVATVRADAAKHPSPNGGVTEAAFAAALGVRLGGTNHYGDVTEDRGRLGSGRPPALADIARAVRLANHLTAFIAATLAASSLIRRWRSPT